MFLPFLNVYFLHLLPRLYVFIALAFIIANISYPDEFPLLKYQSISTGRLPSDQVFIRF